MEQHGHEHAPARDPTHHAPEPDATRLALAATRHCLTGCAIGEVLGLLISGALGFAMEPAMITGIGLAFVFGYSFTFVPLLRSGSVLFWASLAIGFAVAFAATFPVNRWLIVRGRGHVLAHGGHA